MPRTKKHHRARSRILSRPPASVIGPSGEVLTLAEAAAYLRLPEADVVGLVHSQGLPGRCTAGEWRFLKAAIQHWLAAASPTWETRKAAILELVGKYKDDPDLAQIVEDAYRQRGRPITEGGSSKNISDRWTGGAGMLVLETDILSLLLRAHARVTERVAQATEEVAITLISRIEILQGRFASVLKAENSEKLLQAQQRLHESEKEKIPSARQMARLRGGQSHLPSGIASDPPDSPTIRPALGKKRKEKCAQSCPAPRNAHTAPQAYRPWTYVWRPHMAGP